jgi:hypothetical protein
LYRLFVRNVEVGVVPRLLTNNGPKKVAVVVEIFLVRAEFNVTVDVNMAVDA